MIRKNVLFMNFANDTRLFQINMWYTNFNEGLLHKACIKIRHRMWMHFTSFILTAEAIELFLEEHCKTELVHIGVIEIHVTEVYHATSSD